MTLYEFEILNEKKGFHFFKPDTMRFFKSKILDFDYKTGFFLTSEKGPNGVRAYTLRQANFETGNVESVSAFQEYKTIGRAKTAFKNAVKGEK